MQYDMAPAGVGKGELDTPKRQKLVTVLCYG